MIGLSFLAVGIGWLLFSLWLARKMIGWVGVKHAGGRWLLGAVVLAVLLVGPFVDHIVGMRQFEKLCDEQTGLQIYPSAVNAKRGREPVARTELLKGHAIQIKRQTRSIIDFDTGEMIASYNYFSTKGGVLGGPLTALGGEHTCSISGPRHVDHKKFLEFQKQVNLTFGEAN